MATEFQTKRWLVAAGVVAALFLACLFFFTPKTSSLPSLDVIEAP